MVMTNQHHTNLADDLYENFRDTIEGGNHSGALVHAMQLMGEASEQMKAIVANAQLRAATHSDSAMLKHIAGRRALQSEELRIFLQEVNERITTASKARSANSGGFTAAWVDFITGWLSKEDTELVDPTSLEQVARTAATPLASPQRSTPQASSTPRSAQTPLGGSTGGSGGGVSGGGTNSASAGGGAGGGRPICRASVRDGHC